jgi:hypothetical protein
MEQFIKKYNSFTVYDEKGKAFLLQVQSAIYQPMPKET